MSQLENTKVEQSGGGDKITVVLLGKNGNDKSTIGNIILNAEYFTAGNDKCVRAEGPTDSGKICIINTPDHFHKQNPKLETDSIEEIKELYPGRRMFLLILQDQQLSQEEMEMFNQLKVRFGEKMVENTIPVLVSGQTKSKSDQADENLKKLEEECGQRCCVYNRKEDMRGNELIKQVLHKCKMIHKEKDYEARNTAPGQERLYEVINTYEEMKSIPWQVENSKATPQMYLDKANSQTYPDKATPWTHLEKANSQTYPDKAEQSVQTSGSESMTTVVLLGKDSKRKHLIGNKILGKHHFRSEKITCEKIVDTVNGQMMCIINTPDSFHYSFPLDQVADSMKELKPAYRGPRVFLLILHDKKLSSEEIGMFEGLKKKLGEEMVENTIVLVEQKSPTNSMDKQVSFKKHYHKILEECGRRKCVYNRDMTSAELSTELMKYIEKMRNNQTCASDRERAQDSFKQHDHLETAQTSISIREHRRKVMTIVLLGQTGSGKSATGNTILKRRCFESHASSVPVTTECQMTKDSEKKITVIDTPDFFNDDLTDKEEQIKKCKELAHPGPDVYLLVMQLGRFTEGEREVLPNLKKEFGEDVTSKMVVLFTGKEKLKNKTLLEYIEGSDKELQELVKSCHSRYHAFNNNDKNHHQVKKLLDLINDMQDNTGNANYYKKKQTEVKNCIIL